MLMAPHPEERLGFVTEHKWTLVAMGIGYFISGFTLFVGKVMKWNRVIGHGLMGIYLFALFSTALRWYATGIDTAWMHLVFTLTVGGLYLRWKYHILYCPHPNYHLEPLDKTRAVM